MRAVDGAARGPLLGGRTALRAVVRAGARPAGEDAARDGLQDRPPRHRRRVDRRGARRLPRARARRSQARGGADAEGRRGVPAGGREPHRAARADLARTRPSRSSWRSAARASTTSASPSRTSRRRSRTSRRKGSGSSTRSRCPGAGGKRVAFLHPEAGRGVLIELVREGGSRHEESASSCSSTSSTRSEKFWGILRTATRPASPSAACRSRASRAGCARSPGSETVTVLPATVFFPLHRVERIFLDETAGDFVVLRRPVQARRSARTRATT